MTFKAITIFAAVVIVFLIAMAVLGFIEIKNEWRDIFS